MSTQLKKFLQIYDLFAKDPTVSKEFPTLACPRLYPVILSNICLRQYQSIKCNNSLCITCIKPHLHMRFHTALLQCVFQSINSYWPLKMPISDIDYSQRCVLWGDLTFHGVPQSEIARVNVALDDL